MNLKPSRTSATFAATLAAFSALAPALAGCGRGADTASTTTAPVENAPYGAVPAPHNRVPQRQQAGGGMSGKQKAAILVGAAALLYLYKRNQNAKAAQAAQGGGAGANVQYYRSKNGRIYYRDAQGNAIWATPPAGGIQVSPEEAAQYQREAQQDPYYRNFPTGIGAGGPPGAGQL